MVNEQLEKTKDEFAKASGGMRNPTVTTLHAGDVIFRFASTKNIATGKGNPSNTWARGAWWFQEADYRKIIENYKAGKLALGTVARSAGAVQPAYSNMDVSIKARVLQDIKVYVGRGSTQYRSQLPNGMYMTLQGWPDIEQIYIPGVHGAAFNALQIVRQKIITTDNLGLLY
jgi:hypothetical protein